MSDLGLLVKEELNSRDCGGGYDPHTETYTPWYRLRFKVEYVDDLERYGQVAYWKREIQVRNRDILQTSSTLYHEIRHADILPLTILLRAALPLGILLAFAYKGRDDIYTLLFGTAFSLFTIAASLRVLDNLEELCLIYKQKTKFGAQQE